MAGAVLVLSGPPGAGKTTTARAIAESFAKGVHLHTDDLYHWVVSGYVLPWTPDAHDQNTLIQHAVADAAAAYASGGYSVVVDGIVGPWFLEPFRRACAAAGVGIAYAVLRPPLDTVIERAMVRDDMPMPEDGPVRKMYEEFSSLGEFERHVIDTSDLDAQATADAVRKRLEGGTLTLDPLPPTEIRLVPVGYVRGGRAEPIDDDWDSVDAVIELDGSRFGPEVVAGLEEFSHLDVVFFFDRVAESDVTLGARRPRGRADWPEVGIFAQRAKARPNRIGVTTCTLLSVDVLTLHVRGLDAIDGTPVLDIKPHVPEMGPRGDVREPAWMRELMRDYW